MNLFGLGYLLKALLGSLALLIVVMTVWLLWAPGSCWLMGSQPLFLPVYGRWYPLDSGPVWTPFAKKNTKKFIIFRSGLYYATETQSFKVTIHTVNAYEYHGKQAPLFHNEKRYRLWGSATALTNTLPWNWMNRKRI